MAMIAATTLKLLFAVMEEEYSVEEVAADDATKLGECLLLNRETSSWTNDKTLEFFFGYNLI